MNDKKVQESIKIRQFQWYEVETRVREIMSEILQPFSKKQTEDMIRMNEIKRNIATITKKLQDHDFLLDKQSAQKPTYLEIQDGRITQIQTKTEHNQREVDNRVKRMQTIIEVYEQKITRISHLQDRLDIETRQRSNKLLKNKGYLDEQITIMFHKLDQQQDEVNIIRADTRNTTNKLQKKLLIVENVVKEMEGQMRKKTKENGNIFQQVIKISEQLGRNQVRLCDLSDRLAQRQKDTKLSQKFFSKVKQVQNDISFLHKFLDSYQPLYIQMHISDTLNSFLGGIYRQKVCLYEQKKFAEMHHHLLINDNNDLSGLMSAATNKIKKIVNRNKKYVINMEVQNTVKYGANTYEFRSQDYNMFQENMQQQIYDKNKDGALKISQQQLKETMQQKISTFKIEIVQTMQEHFKTVTNWLQQMQQQAYLSDVERDNKLNRLKQTTQQQSNMGQLQEKAIDNFYKDLHKNSANLQVLNGNIKQFMRQVLNFSSVLNHILIQDEIDRQSTALYAISNSKGHTSDTIQPTLRLNQQCMSCQHKNTSIIQQAFKMACIAYNPSQIKIDNQVYSREQILQISTHILQQLKRRIEQNSSSTIIKLPKPQQQLYKTQQRSQRIMNRTILSSNKSSSSRNGQLDTKIGQYQTLLPAVSSAVRGRKSQQKERRMHNLSIFY